MFQIDRDTCSRSKIPDWSAARQFDDFFRAQTNFFKHGQVLLLENLAFLYMLNMFLVVKGDR